MGGALPVDPARLRAEFPELTEEDLAAYVEVTQRLLAQPEARGRLLREVMAVGQDARRRSGTGSPLSPDEERALRYLRALEKMQRSTVRPK